MLPLKTFIYPIYYWMFQENCRKIVSPPANGPEMSSSWLLSSARYQWWSGGSRKVIYLVRHNTNPHSNTGADHQTSSAQRADWGFWIGWWKSKIVTESDMVKLLFMNGCFYPTYTDHDVTFPQYWPSLCAQINICIRLGKKCAFDTPNL